MKEIRYLINIATIAMLLLCAMAILFFANKSHSDSSQLTVQTVTPKTQIINIPTTLGQQADAYTATPINGSDTGLNYLGSTDNNRSLVCPPGNTLVQLTASTTGHRSNPSLTYISVFPTATSGRPQQQSGNWVYIPTCYAVDTTWSGNCTNVSWVANYNRMQTMIGYCQPVSYVWN